MARWVYRRPADIRRRRFVPNHKRNNALVFRPRWRAWRQRWLYRRRRQVHVGGAAAAAAGAFLVTTRRRAERRIRQRARALKFAGGVQQQVNNKPTPFGRILREVARMRRAMQRRLRWRPRPEPIPPAIERFESPEVGRVFVPGAVRGRVVDIGEG